MKKIIIAPDSFKGTMSSIKAGKIIKKKLEQRYPYEFIALPVSDGGEGALSALKAQKKIKTRREWVTGPNFKKIKCMIGIYQKDTIVIESADIVGFKHKKKNSTPGRTTTLGIGELIYKYYRKGYKKFILCLGGTITNDGGCGILSALGVKFYNEREEEFVPVGDTLQEIKRITQPSPIKELDVTVLADVKNPLSGTTGASYVYAKQKGATDADVVRLDAGLRHFAEVSKKHLGFDYSMKPGSGAAGGIGFAIFSYLNGKYESGIDKILEMISFDSFLKGSSLLITGEGMLDRQDRKSVV